MDKNKKDKKLINKFIEEYEKSMKWYQNNVKEAAKIVVKHLPMLKEKAIEIGIKNITIKTINSKESQYEIENWFNDLKHFNSKLIGGKLLDDNFYH